MNLIATLDFYELFKDGYLVLERLIVLDSTLLHGLDCNLHT
jgi:hypothetical protein